MAPAAAQLILRWLDEHADEQVGLLERLAAAESPSLDPASQRGPFTILAAELARIGYLARPVRSAGAGDHLYARPRRRRRGAPRQLVIGHMDTVWPVGTIEEMPLRRDDGLLFGPGVADMKGGLVEIVFALRALYELELQPVVTPVVLVNTDEEIGSGGSTRFISMLAKGAERAFVLESGEGADGKLKIARKGLGRFTVTVRGRSSHAGASFERGVSAILELSHQVQRLFALNDPARGITVNVGTIDGGLRPNVVAPTARATVDVRVPTAATANRLERAIRDLQPILEGATIEVEGGFGRPPMEPLPRNRALLAKAMQHGHALGLALEDAGLVGGGSDANTTSRFTGTLDGLGPIGEGSHAADERIDTTSLPTRTALLALLLLEPPIRPLLATRRSRRARARPTTPAATRVAICGTDASETNLELVAAWRDLGIDAILLGSGALAGWLRPRDVTLGRLDVLPTLDGVEPGLVELLLLERRGLNVLNSAFALAAAHDKLLTASLLSRAGIPHPRTRHVRPSGNVPDISPPLVVKPRLGSWGIDVFRCDTEDALLLCLDEIRRRPWFERHGALIQELIPPVGHDLRLVVAGGSVVGAIRRSAAPGEWRTNITLGGTGSPARPDAAACELALAAAAALHADLVGVDLLPTADGYSVVELNGAVDFGSSYGFPGSNIFRDAAQALGFFRTEAVRSPSASDFLSKQTNLLGAPPPA